MSQALKVCRLTLCRSYWTNVPRLWQFPVCGFLAPWAPVPLVPAFLVGSFAWLSVPVLLCLVPAIILSLLFSVPPRAVRLRCCSQGVWPFRCNTLSTKNSPIRCCSTKAGSGGRRTAWTSTAPLPTPATLDLQHTGGQQLDRHWLKALRGVLVSAEPWRGSATPSPRRSGATSTCGCNACALQDAANCERLHAKQVQL